MSKEEPLQERIHREWRNRVRAEYTSAAITAQVVHWMLQCGVEESLVHVALRIVRDEMDHARLSHEALVALGGSEAPSVLHPDHLAMAPASEGVLASLVDSVVRNFCLGETFAVPLFHAMRENASHPSVLPMLTRVLKDEAVHRAFGWDMLDHLVEREPEGVRARTEHLLPGWLQAYANSYAHSPEATQLSEQEQAAGMLAPSEYNRIFHETVQETLVPWFLQRGIALGLPAEESLPERVDEG